MRANPKLLFTIATTSGVPIYRQIIDQIKTHIATGKIEAGTFLPSVRQVAEELEINPMTVSKAYSILERDNILESLRGKGMIIKESAKPQKDLKNREEEIVPLIKEVIIRASQLSLSPKRVTQILKSLWEGENHE